VLEWVALTDLPADSVPVVCAAVDLLDCDGEELLDMRVKIVQKLLAKSGADDPIALAKLAIEQRDVLTRDDGKSTAAIVQAKLPAGAAPAECLICFEHYTDDESGQLVPRILSCGHTLCHGCVSALLADVKVNGDAPTLRCPSLCHKLTRVLSGKASELLKNYSLV
jgi:hypothetical protein